MSNTGTLIWITGLSGAGKSTISKALFSLYKPNVPNLVYLDGDIYRACFGSTGYSREERLEVAKKISALCGILVGQGIHVVCATISLFHEIQAENRKNIPNYVEVFVSCSMEELLRRDQKGLYSKANAGQINNVVGVDIPIEQPLNPDLTIENESQNNLHEKVQAISNLLRSKNLLV